MNVYSVNVMKDDEGGFLPVTATLVFGFDVFFPVVRVRVVTLANHA